MSLGSYKFKENSIVLNTRYDEGFITAVKNIMGRNYDEVTRTWRIPINTVTAGDITDLIEEYSLINLSDDGSTLESMLLPQDIERSLEGKKREIQAKLSSLLIQPRPYQLDGIAYNLIARRCINGSDMGTGKTFTTIFTIEVEKLFPCLLVVPTSVKYNWLIQWKRVNPERSISLIEGTKKDNFDADVLLTTYGMLGTNIINDKGNTVARVKIQSLKDKRFTSLVVDESQNIKNSGSVRSKALKKLSRKIEYIFLLTGTPIMNRPSELINPLDVLRIFENLFHSWNKYVARYCNAKQDNYGVDISGASNLIELNEKISKACYYRVEKRDVLKDLPPLQETILEVDITNRKTYRKAEGNLVAYVQENFGQERALAASMAEQLVLVNTLSKLSVEGKLEPIADWLDTFLESTNEKIVVFGIHTSVLLALSHYYQCDHITGDVSAKQRQEIVNNFQKDNKRILFLNIMTGGVGIDGLQNVCSTVAIIELPWRWADVDQAISRIERDGQKSNIEVYYFLGRDTIDMATWDMLMHKREITTAVNAGIEVDTNKYLNDMIKSYVKAL